MKSGIVESNNPRLLPKRSAYPACPYQFILCISIYILSPQYNTIDQVMLCKFLQYFGRTINLIAWLINLNSRISHDLWLSGAKVHLIVVISMNTHGQTWTADQFGVNEPLYRWAIWACSCIYYTTVLKVRENFFSQFCDFFRTPSWTWTKNFLFNRQLLYLLSLMG